MKIQWLGHSCFRLTESTGTTIITDPFDAGAVGYSMPYLTADGVTSSHAHNDHNAFNNVKGGPEIFTQEGSFDLKGVHMTAMKSSHGENAVTPAENLIFRYRLDGVEVCHMGDIGVECNPELAEQLMSVNVLLIPVGGYYTIDAEAAKEYVDHLMPDFVFPMHFKTKDCDYDIDKVDAFVRLFDKDDVIYCDTDEIELDRDEMDGSSSKLVLLKRFLG